VDSVVASWLLALALTVGIETAIALGIGGTARRRLLLDVPLVNLFTHPLATVAYHHLGAPFWAVEVAVLAVEAAVYRFVTGLPWPRALILATLCNAVTAALSFVL
jgi:hypothetical protein